MTKPITTVLGCALAAGLCATPALAQSQQPQKLPPVEVQQKHQKPARAVKKPTQNQAPEAVPAGERERSLAAAPVGGVVTGAEIADKKATTNDTAQLLSGVPGVNTVANGGVSSWPQIHGMADERLRTEVNGMLLTAACPNHMNPVLSYVDPAAVGQVKVYTGITPVSAGGDSIGGTIRVEGAPPLFASGDGSISYGYASIFGRSNGNGLAAGGSVSSATSNTNITYTGAWAKSGDYKDGHGDTVYSSLYESQNHKLALAIRDKDNLLVVEAGLQHIPYEGFPNMYMDMTNNDSWFVNARYTGRTDWGKLDLRAYFQDVRHEMDLTSEGNKQMYMPGPLGTGLPMPMDTHGQNFGYSAKAEIPQSARDTLRIGSDFHGFLLDEWWPPVPIPSRPGPYGMCCNTFWNINGGQRYDLGAFGEWERKWTPQWTTLVGVRSETVWTNTGDVKGYNDAVPGMYAKDAQWFNSLDREHTFSSFDATALARYQADLWNSFEGGYSMKTRAPSLYELYAWSTNKMGAEMNGWGGDGNMYIGNNNLKPETAHTLSFSYDLHEARSTKDGGGNGDWELKVTPYYSYVEDYIDVRRCTASDTHGVTGAKCNPQNAKGAVELIYVNQDAQIFGADLYARVPLMRSYDYGKLSLVGIAGYDRGMNLSRGGNLYHMMPLNAKLTLEHKLGNWSSAAEMVMVSNKDVVEAERRELETPGYALVNLRSSYQWENIRFDLGVENLFNQQYYSPLGGAYLGDQAAGKAGWMGTGSFEPLAGMGRNIYGGITVKF